MKTPKAGDTVKSWGRALAKQMYGKPSVGAVEKSKERHAKLEKKHPHYKEHQAVGGKLRFMTEHHPEMKKHRAHEKALEGRKENYHKFISGKK